MLPDQIAHPLQATDHLAFALIDVVAVQILRAVVSSNRSSQDASGPPRGIWWMSAFCAPM